MKRHKFIRVEAEGKIHIFELDGKRIENVNDETGTAPCPCCQAPVKPVFDVTQYGMFDDKIIVLFVCLDCGKAWWYSQVYSRIELTEEANNETGIL